MQQPFKIIVQSNLKGCGAACISMIALHYGKETSYVEIQNIYDLYFPPKIGQGAKI